MRVKYALHVIPGKMERKLRSSRKNGGFLELINIPGNIPGINIYFE